MKIAVVPDVHAAPNLDRVEQALERESPDLTIFVGDFFDQFHDGVAEARRTATWLRSSLRRPARIHLMGNHDLAYAYPSEETYCSGFTPEKCAVIREIIPESEWTLLRLTYWWQNWLFTHAGCSRHFAPNPPPPSLAEFRQWLSTEEESAWAALSRRQSHWIFEAGRLRGGKQIAGGLLWADESEFRPVPGVCQVFGHTPGHLSTVVRGSDGSLNICLDTSDRYHGVRHYLVLTADRVLTKNIAGDVVKTVVV